LTVDIYFLYNYFQLKDKVSLSVKQLNLVDSVGVKGKFEITGDPALGITTLGVTKFTTKSDNGRHP
jgi:hypothetical protein